MSNTGPRTSRGRKAVSQNARSHGIFSEVGVIPGVESDAEWAQHLQGIRDSYEPANYLEELLTEEVARYFWRLRRVARYEQGALALASEGLSLTYGSTILQDSLLEDRRAIEVSRLIPEATVLDRLARYESHLHRKLIQIMHELESNQRRRQGKEAPLARLDISVSSLDESP